MVAKKNTWAMPLNKLEFQQDKDCNRGQEKDATEESPNLVLGGQREGNEKRLQEEMRPQVYA